MKAKSKVQIVWTPQQRNRQTHAAPCRMHFSRFILAAFCLAVCHFVCLSPVIAQDATGSIKGKVIDRQSNKPLVDQKVMLTIHQGAETQQREAITASDGSYSFDNLSIGMGTYYTVATNYEGKEHVETDVVLSTWVPESNVDIEIGASTDDHSVVKVRQHTVIIGPPPPDHAPDGAVSIMELIQFENTSEMDFQTTVNSQSAGMYLNLPDGHENLQIDPMMNMNLVLESNKMISRKPLPPGKFGSGFSYIMHIENSGLDLSRDLTFDTDQLYVFVTEGLPLVPQSPLFGAARREQFHLTTYIIYATNPAKPLVMGKAASLNLKVAPVASPTGNVGKNTAQPANPRMIALIAFAAACASGFLVAAIFMVRSGAAKATESNATQTSPDASWLNKLGFDDLDSARIARFEMVTRLDEMYKKKEITERVYNRLRKEQVDRLTPILEKTRRTDQ
ncbi:MAG: carboxypeptidase-like regulatory domain-containing protein [Candidatus Poribacteria bacterium]|nr:carboxypeptidase-like regulatory domain-containing protein [Candidatus Poribacteria bacterium]